MKGQDSQAGHKPSLCRMAATTAEDQRLGWGKLRTPERLQQNEGLHDE